MPIPRSEGPPSLWLRSSGAVGSMTSRLRANVADASSARMRCFTTAPALPRVPSCCPFSCSFSRDDNFSLGQLLEQTSNQLCHGHGAYSCRAFVGLCAVLLHRPALPMVPLCYPASRSFSSQHKSASPYRWRSRFRAIAGVLSLACPARFQRHISSSALKSCLPLTLLSSLQRVSAQVATSTVSVAVCAVCSLGLG